jgi:hypothetical protein
MDKWNKFTYVCNDIDNCDTLVQATSRGTQLEYARCPACCKRLNLISIENVTIKEEE